MLRRFAYALFPGTGKPGLGLEKFEHSILQYTGKDEMNEQYLSQA